MYFPVARKRSNEHNIVRETNSCIAVYAKGCHNTYEDQQ